jgi:hypothetical protein
METSKVMASFVKALKMVQAAEKTRTNPQFKSTYADLSSVIEQANAALHPNGLAFSQEVTTDKEGVSVATIIMHESGEVLQSMPCWLPVTQKTPQGYGSAITYCRRYSLKARMGMPDEDDDGNAATGTGNTKPPPPEGMAALREKIHPPPENRAPNGAVFPNYGKAKGQPIHGASQTDLEYYLNGAKRTLADPGKARFHETEAKLVAAIEAELARQ